MNFSCMARNRFPSPPSPLTRPGEKPSSNGHLFFQRWTREPPPTSPPPVRCKTKILTFPCLLAGTSLQLTQAEWPNEVFHAMKKVSQHTQTQADSSLHKWGFISKSVVSAGVSDTPDSSVSKSTKNTFLRLRFESPDSNYHLWQQKTVNGKQKLGKSTELLGGATPGPQSH